jgi:hypothetical protein
VSRRGGWCSPSTLPLLAAMLVLLCASSALALGPCTGSNREGPWYVPAHAKVQTGGYLGALTLGAGYAPWQVLEVGAYYGWVPASLGGVDIHSVALRLGARVRGTCVARDWNWVYLTGGVGALFTAGDGFFLTVPERYHDPNYYRRTGVRGLLTVGTELNRRQSGGSFVASQGVFVEVTTIDEYLRLWAKSPRAEPFLATFSTSLGYRIGFR